MTDSLQTPPANPSPSPERLAQLFRHVLQTAQGRHLWQLVEQYRKEANP